MAKKDMSQSIQDAVVSAAKTVADITDDVVTAAEPTLKAAADMAQPIIKEVSDKAQPIIKEVSDKAQPIIKEVGKKAQPVIKQAKKAGKAAIAAIVPEVYVQVAGKELVCTDLIERCKADFKKSSKASIRSCKIYVKPEEAKAYYVINNTAGHIDL